MFLLILGLFLEESRMKCNAINVILFFDKKIRNTKGIAHDKLYPINGKRTIGNL